MRLLRISKKWASCLNQVPISFLKPSKEPTGRKLNKFGSKKFEIPFKRGRV